MLCCAAGVELVYYFNGEQAMETMRPTSSCSSVFQAVVLLPLPDSPKDLHFHFITSPGASMAVYGWIMGLEW